MVTVDGETTPSLVMVIVAESAAPLEPPPPVDGGVGDVGESLPPPHAIAAPRSIATANPRTQFPHPCFISNLRWPAGLSLIELSRDVDADIPVVVAVPTAGNRGHRRREAVREVQAELVASYSLLDAESHERFAVLRASQARIEFGSRGCRRAD